MCILARVGLISRQREGVRRRQDLVAMRLEAQWMEEGAVDSLPPETWLAKERLMSWSLNKNKCIPNTHFFMKFA